MPNTTTANNVVSITLDPDKPWETAKSILLLLVENIILLTIDKQGKGTFPKFSGIPVTTVLKITISFPVQDLQDYFDEKIWAEISDNGLDIILHGPVFPSFFW